MTGVVEFDQFMSRFCNHLASPCFLSSSVGPSPVSSNDASFPKTKKVVIRAITEGLIASSTYCPSVLKLNLPLP